MARAIFGKSRHILRGKTVRRQPEHVREDTITDVPQHILTNYGDITLSVDIYSVNRISILGTISRHLKF